MGWGPGVLWVCSSSFSPTAHPGGKQLPSLLRKSRQACATCPLGARGSAPWQRTGSRCLLGLAQTLWSVGAAASGLFLAGLWPCAWDAGLAGRQAVVSGGGGGGAQQALAVLAFLPRLLQHSLPGPSWLNQLPGEAAAAAASALFAALLPQHRLLEPISTKSDFGLPRDLLAQTTPWGSCQEFGA